jgi:O-antigen/teichoic acid export membrane protein
LAVGFRSRTLPALRSIFTDPLYRGSLTLLINSAVLTIFGVAFWTIATHSYPASTVGVFSGVTAGIGLLATVATLGLQNTITRYVASTENPRGLVVSGVSVIATVGTMLCLITVITLGPHLPSSLHLQQPGRMVFLATVLVAVTAVSTVFDAGLIATRASSAVLFKNAVGSAVKVAALFLLADFRNWGLLLAYSAGLFVATGGGGLALFRRVSGFGLSRRSFGVLRGYLSMTAGNYIATIMGILPASVVPLEVLARQGPTETAHFGTAFMAAGFLSIIPSTVAGVLFAEASRHVEPIGKQLRKALRGIYGLLLPAMVLLIAAAPLVLRIFGSSYAAAGTGCLRILALSGLPMGGTYLVDSLLIARDRMSAYVFINGANAALVLGFVAILVPRGITAAASGWTLAQVASLLIGLGILAMGRTGRHSYNVPIKAVPTTESASPRRANSQRSVPELDLAKSEAQIRELLAAWPTMPTTMIAERIGWDQSVAVLLDRVTKLRRAYLHSGQVALLERYRAGETAQCGFWFPPVEIPVGFGQTRTAMQLPVLTMITGYSRWISALLIPSRQAGDLFLGWWELLDALGAVPKVQIWENERAIGVWRPDGMRLTYECEDFCDALGTAVIVGKPADPDTGGLLEKAHVYLESSFLRGRTFDSPEDFNIQLSQWLSMANTRNRTRPSRSPAELITADRLAMQPLPHAAPKTGWRLNALVQDDPVVAFDSNYYCVPQAMINKRVRLWADLTRVAVLADRRVAAAHTRCWGTAQIVEIANPTSSVRRQDPG